VGEQYWFDFELIGFLSMLLNVVIMIREFVLLLLIDKCESCLVIAITSISGACVGILSHPFPLRTLSTCSALHSTLAQHQCRTQILRHPQPCKSYDAHDALEDVSWFSELSYVVEKPDT